jgi:hypothetical protein
MDIPTNLPIPDKIKSLINDWNSRYTLINELCEDQNDVILKTMADSLQAVIDETPIDDFSAAFVFCAPLLT